MVDVICCLLVIRLFSCVLVCVVWVALFVVSWSVFGVFSLLVVFVVVRCVLLVACCLLIVTCCFPNLGCWLFSVVVACCVLLVVGCLLFVACYLLFVVFVCCVLFVVACGGWLLFFVVC